MIKATQTNPALKATKAMLAGAALCALVACEIKQQPSDAETEHEHENAASPGPAPSDMPVSILRPEVEQPASKPSAAAVPQALDATISFAAGGSALDQKAIEALEALLATPQLAAGGKITLKGHSDSGGSDAANLGESRARANAVRDYLIAQGVADERFSIIAFGEQNPIAPNALPDGSPNEAGRAANRRVEVRIEVADGTVDAPDVNARLGDPSA